MIFCKEQLYGYLCQGNLHHAMEYLEQFPDQRELYEAYLSIFSRETYRSYGLAEELESLLLCYQKYYRDTFYLLLDPAEAEEKLRLRLSGHFPGAAPGLSLSELEDTHITKAFLSHDLHFLGGRTGSWRGPYIWRSREDRTYSVALPDGTCSYTVRMLDGFLCKSWLDYLSFGSVTPGGWTSSDGVINCIRESYDLDSEAFTVSLLKHEAQHAMDLNRWPGLSSSELEYRAKLVELIYSEERRLLPQFAMEADTSTPGNGHAVASFRLISEFSNILGTTDFDMVPISKIQSAALYLFRKSTPGT